LERASAFTQTRDQLSAVRQKTGGKIQRNYFVFLMPPPNGQTDLVWGSWWFIYGSVCQAIIPVAPLVSLFLEFWESTSTFLPLDIHVCMYALQVVVGIFFTIGSYAFLRAVHPELQAKPYFNPENRQDISCARKLCMTDELWGMWCFFFGVLSGIPIFAFFVHYAGSASFGYWELILLVNCFVVLLVGFGVRIAWPSGHTGTEKQLLAPTFIWLFGGFKAIKPHVQNDMLILSWGMYFSCILGLIGCLGLLAIATRHGAQREIYDYAANSVDMVMFLVGALYFTAGWYVVQPGSSDDGEAAGGGGGGGTLSQLDGAASVQSPPSPPSSSGKPGSRPTTPSESAAALALSAAAQTRPSSQESSPLASTRGAALSHPRAQDV